MISIPRSLLSRFRSLIRKAGLYRRSTAAPGFTIAAAADGCLMRCASQELAIQYRQAGSFVPGEHRLPLEALTAIDGRQGDVTFQTDGQNRTVLTWIDHDVPRQASFDAPKPAPFPAVPTSFVTNEPALWSALRDAVPVTDRDATRYALGCVCLRGALGRIDATDGRHVLTQAGFEFPWTDDVLLPAHGLLGCKTLDSGVPVGVGRSADGVGFQAGDWLVLAAERKDGRWPKLDEIIPKAEAAQSRLELSPADAQFLQETLPRLPNGDPVFEPITLDLHGQLWVRAREAEQARPTQVELPSSRLVGEPVVLPMNRRYLVEALRLGFRTLHGFGPQSPVLCADERRRFLWCLLDAAAAIPRHADPLRVEPPRAVVPASTAPVMQRAAGTVDLKKPLHVAPVAPADAAATGLPLESATASPAEQAAALRNWFRTGARQAEELVRLLRKPRRRGRPAAAPRAA